MSLEFDICSDILSYLLFVFSHPATRIPHLLFVFSHLDTGISHLLLALLVSRICFTPLYEAQTGTLKCHPLCFLALGQ